MELLLSDRDAIGAAARAAASGEAWVQPAVRRLRADADIALSRGPFSVTFKPGRAPSNDPHDYASVNTYAWPNPDTADGLPYVVRDGLTTPERDRYDIVPLRTMCDCVATLGLAHAVAGDERNAEHAGRLLRTWFLDPATRMNPHLRHAQFHPGRTDGSPHGVIDTNRFPDLLDGASLLASPSSPTLRSSWSTDDQSGLRAWFETYLRWLTESDFGRTQAARGNNIATWLDVQVVAFALFVGDEARARDVITTRGVNRIAQQVEPDGSQPAELGRTLGLSYSLYNLAALVLLARLAERVGVDLWAHETRDGRSIRGALDFLLPYLDGSSRWPHWQIKPLTAPGRRSLEPDRFARVLRLARLKWGDERYERALIAMPGVDAQSHRVNLLYPRPR